jgi:hypothetical protein
MPDELFTRLQLDAGVFSLDIPSYRTRSSFDAHHSGRRVYIRVLGTPFVNMPENGKPTALMTPGEQTQVLWFGHVRPFCGPSNR